MQTLKISKVRENDKTDLAFTDRNPVDQHTNMYDNRKKSS